MDIVFLFFYAVLNKDMDIIQLQYFHLKDKNNEVCLPQKA